MTAPPPYTDPPLHRYRFGSAEFDESRFDLKVAGRLVKVQRKALKVLALLLRNAGEVVTRDELLDQVWDNRPTVEHVINNALAKLRAALGPIDAGMILTQQGVGYRFEGKLERTVIGRAVHSELALVEGGTVPWRTNFLMVRMLGRSREHEVWLGRQQRTGEQRVYKFCLEGARLAGLKREATLARVLREQLGPREDLVRLIDWNFEQPPYFLESEYGGISLREWADSQERLKNSAWPERLDLALQIIDAVGAAHSVGVIHKDLKPANVLVYPDARGWRIKIADFGSGRMLDTERLSELALSRLGFTVTQHRTSDPDSGTPFYLAPELLGGGSATVQSDVYALGLMLYQLRVGDLTRPLVPGWERNIDDPLLRSDIALATDVDPGHRLAGAQVLALRLRSLDERHRDARRQEDDVRRQQEVEAQRLVLIESQRRSRARAPWVRSTIALLLLGVGIASAFYWRAHRDAYRLAEQVQLVARLNRFLTEDFIKAADPEIAGRTDVTVASAARTAAAHIDRDLPAGPYGARATLHSAMQETFSGLADYTAAIAEGQLALRDLTAAGADAGFAAHADALLRVRLQLASDLAQLSRFPEAETNLKEARARFTPQTSALLQARAEFVRGFIDQQKLDFKDAIVVLKHALDLMRGLPDDDSDLSARIELSLGDGLTAAGQYAEGESMLRDLIQRQTRRDGPDGLRADYTRVALASNLGYQARYPEAETLAEGAAGRYQEAFGPDHRRTLKALLTVANLNFQQGNYGRAAVVYGDLYDRVARKSGVKQDLAITLGLNRSVALQRTGETDEAVALLKTQLQIAREFLADTAPRVETLRYHLADCELDLGHDGDDVGRLLEGLDPALLAASQQEPDWDGLLAYQNGRLSLLRGNRAQARESLQLALQVIKERDPDGAVSPGRIVSLLQSL